MMILKGPSFPVAEKFKKEHAEEYAKAQIALCSYQSKRYRHTVDAETVAFIEAFRQHMIDAGCEKGSLPVIDRPLLP